MDIKAFIIENAKNENIDEELFKTKILSLDEQLFGDVLSGVLELKNDETISKSEGLKILTHIMNSFDSEVNHKAQVAHTLIQLETYKAIPILTDFITEQGPEKTSNDEAIKYYYETKNAVLDVITEMAWNKTKALSGLFRIAEIGESEFQREAIKRIKELYHEKPKDELLQMIGEEAERQGDQSLLYELYMQLRE